MVEETYVASTATAPNRHMLVRLAKKFSPSSVTSDPPKIGPLGGVIDVSSTSGRRLFVIRNATVPGMLKGPSSPLNGGALHVRADELISCALLTVRLNRHCEYDKLAD
eukprot:6942520-Prymnesium_polylepis.1